MSYETVGLLLGNHINSAQNFGMFWNLELGKFSTFQWIVSVRNMRLRLCKTAAGRYSFVRRKNENQQKILDFDGSGYPGFRGNPFLPEDPQVAG